MNTETNPVTTITAIIAAVGTLIASAVKASVLLGLVAWTPEQVAGITLVVDNALVVVSSLLIIVLVKDKVTPVAAPNLPIGTTVNANSPAPTGVVEPVAGQP